MRKRAKIFVSNVSMSNFNKFVVLNNPYICVQYCILYIISRHILISFFYM